MLDGSFLYTLIGKVQLKMCPPGANQSRCNPPPAAGSTASGVLFRTRSLTKTWKMGEVEIHALCGIDLELYAGEPAILIMNRRTDTGTHWYEVGRAGFAWVMHRGADGGYPVVPAGGDTHIDPIGGAVAVAAEA